MNAVEAEIKTLPQHPYTAGTGRFEREKKLVDQLPPAPKRQAGRERLIPPEPPAGGFRQLHADRFSVEYPVAWETFGQPDSALVAIAPRQGLVQDRFGNVAVGYGAILSYYFPAGGRRDLRQSTSELINRLEAGNPTLQILAKPKRARVGGSQALITSLSSSSPYGGGERNVLVTINRPEGLFYVVFVAPEKVYGQLDGTFQKILNSIQFRG